MTTETQQDLSRRHFLSSFATLFATLGGVELTAQPAAQTQAPSPASTRVKCAVVGLGPWGREILATLSRLTSAQVAVVCDSYPGAVKRAALSAPDAAGSSDYRQVLADKSIAAVVVATPSHLHRDVAIEALQAGKHVYCEAPLATTLDDARAIARVARGLPHQHFQVGLQARADPLRLLAVDFLRSGALGKPVLARAQWHKKTSWRRTAPTPERERELNWRLNKEVSLGLIGECAVHHLDFVSWLLKARPVAVRGFGSVMHWKDDGREVPDTLETVLEYPEGFRFVETCTLANSFDSDYELFYGSDAALLCRGGKAWMFKEADAPLLGWEVNARKDSFYKETGIVLLANASKQQAPAEGVSEQAASLMTPLYYALEGFLRSVGDLTSAAEDFTAAYGADDPKARQEHLAKIPRQPGAGWAEGFESALIALKANEAILGNRRIEFRPEWFELS